MNNIVSGKCKSCVTKGQTSPTPQSPSNSPNQQTTNESLEELIIRIMSAQNTKHSQDIQNIVRNTIKDELSILESRITKSEKAIVDINTELLEISEKLNSIKTESNPYDPAHIDISSSLIEK